MARGTQLQKMQQMLRQELSRATSIAVGVDDLPTLTQKLVRNTELLYDDYDWPWLRERWLIPLQTGERYYDFPDTPNGDQLNPERVEEAWVYINNLPRPIERGINEEDFASFNSDIGVVSDPLLKWDIRWTPGQKEQIEAWPIPASNSGTLVLRGIRKLRPLVNPSDVCDLDDQCVVLWTAAELAAKDESGSAGVLKAAALSRIARMRGRTRGSAKRYRMGLGPTPEARPFTIVVRTS